MEMADISMELNSQGSLAMRALQEHSEKKRGKMLFPEFDANILLSIKYKRTPLVIEGPQRRNITLPCPDRNASNISICLIMPDTDMSRNAVNDPDVDRQAREWAEDLRERLGLVSGIDYAKIFTFNQLTREYTQWDERAKLANAYDIFMVDRMLVRKVSTFMGKLFRKPTKPPLLINSHKDFTKDIKAAPSITQLVLVPMNDTVTIRIGNLNQPLADLESNLNAVVHLLLQNFPGGPINIRTCYIQSMGISLPIYVHFGSANDVQLTKPKTRQYSVEMDEITTLPEGLAVKVRADGQVKVVEKESGQEVLYPTMEDEWEQADDLKPMTKEKIQERLQKMARKKLKHRKSEAEKNVKEELEKPAKIVKMKKVKKGKDELKPKKEEELTQPNTEEKELSKMNKDGKRKRKRHNDNTTDVYPIVEAKLPPFGNKKNSAELDVSILSLGPSKKKLKKR